MCFQHYGLDPGHNYISPGFSWQAGLKMMDVELILTHNYTFPGLSWQAALKMMNVELNLLTDIDQHLFIKEGSRRGVAMIIYQ